MKGNNLLIVLLVAVGGYFAYQAWQKQQYRAGRIAAGTTALISRTAAEVFGGTLENPFAIKPRMISRL